MTQTKNHLDLYDASKTIYVEGNLLLVGWVEYVLGDRKSSHLASHIFLLAFTKVLVKLYSEALRDSLRYIQKAISIQHDDYNYLLLESMVLYGMGEINPAICSFRRAFSYKNEMGDPFYKSKRKEERYEAEIATIHLQNINSVLEIGFLKNEITKKNKQEDLSLEQLIHKFNSCENPKEKIVFLEKVKKKSTKIKNDQNRYKEVYIFILKHIDALLSVNEESAYELYYMQGECFLKLALMDNKLTDERTVFEIYRAYTKALNIVTIEYEKTREKLNRYKERIIDLITNLDNYLIELTEMVSLEILIIRTLCTYKINAFGKNVWCMSMNNLDTKMIDLREHVGKSATRKIEELTYEQSNIEEVKYLCSGDIYAKIGNGSGAIKSYLKALKSWKQQDLTSSWKDLKRSKKHRDRWKRFSNEELANFYTENGREGIKSLLKEIDDSLNLKEYGEYYSLLWQKIGQGLFYSNRDYFHAVDAYTEALEYVDEIGKIEILLLRSKAHLKIKNIAEAKKDVVKALDIDRNSFEIASSYYSKMPHLKMPQYRNLVRALADIYYKQAHRNNIDFKNLFVLGNMFGRECDYYKDLRRKYEITHYKSQHQKFWIDQCCKRIAQLHYIEGDFIYKKTQYLESNRSFKKQRYNIEVYIGQSVKAYKKALEELGTAVKPWSVDYYIDYFMLEIITDFIKASSNFPEKYYEDTQGCLRRGGELLRRLQKAEKDRANKVFKVFGQPQLPRFITKEKLNRNFEVIESFAISHIKGDKNALEHAEARKNLCLTGLTDKGQVTKKREFSYERVGDILSLNTAIVYWYVGITEITLFVIFKSQDASVSITKEIFDNKEYIKFKRSVEAWELVMNSVGKSPSANFLVGMENCLNDFYETLSIQRIRGILRKNEYIENVILIPHRDLHKIPLHIFFCDFYKKEEHLKENYNLTYLPSIELGLHLDLNFIANPELLIVHPFDIDNHDLLSSYAESAGVYLRFCKSLSRVPKKLEGDPDARKATVSQELQNNISFNYFHFLGHARHDFNQPKQSALNLTGSKHLTWEHILKELDFSSYYLVCLSACETGVTSTTSLLSEYVGLVSAFLETGASYVVSSLWKIEDISASLLMIEFYRLISLHEHPVRALEKAQYWLRTASRKTLGEWCKHQATELYEIIDQLPNPEHEKQRLEASIELIEDYSYLFLESSKPFPFEHPYYWAGFVVTGLPQQTENGKLVENIGELTVESKKKKF